ncbi:MAG TPA: NAD(P)H-binding protein [Candidatus Saccharimonadales bacterium]
MESKRQITVFGANGGVGQGVVRLLLERGYIVVAAVHSESRLPAHENLRVVTADIYDAVSVEQAVAGSSAVISALGSWGTKRKDILTIGMTNIIPAMEVNGIRRIVSVTGADARATGDKMGLIHRLTHLALGIMASKVLRDGERHTDLLEKSDLDWTVIRSPIMSSRDNVGYGVLSLHRPMPWQRVSRRYVVEAIARSLENDEWLQQAPYIS